MMNELIKFFIAGLIGVLFGGLILGFIVDLIFSNWVDSGTTAFGNWAMWVGAIATICAAVGTIGTLYFLVRQHFENSAREQEMWDEQREKLIFDKYNGHKNLFISLLNEYEQSNSYGITIRNKHNFYRRMFPNNTLNNFNSTLSEDELGDFHPIRFAYSYLEKAHQEFHRIAIKDQYSPEELITSVAMLLDTLQISIQNKGMGDVLIMHTRRYVNCFDTKLIMNEVEVLLDLLLDFASYKAPEIRRTVNDEGESMGYAASTPIDRIATHFIEKSDGFFIKTDFGHKDIMKKIQFARLESQNFLTVPRQDLAHFQYALSFVHFSKDWEELRLAQNGTDFNSNMLFNPNDEPQVELFISKLKAKLNDFLDYPLPVVEKHLVRKLITYLDS